MLQLGRVAAGMIQRGLRACGRTRRTFRQERRSGSERIEMERRPKKPGWLELPGERVEVDDEKERERERDVCGTVTVT